MTTTYDAIGDGYARQRQPDRRIAEVIHRSLDRMTSVLNVGAGAGAYESDDRGVIAGDASMVMIRQRPASSAPAVQASAMALPFADRAFDAATAFLTIHHWPDWREGLRELARVARQRVVLFTWDPEAPPFWLVADYFPELLATDRHIFPELDAIAAELGPVRVEPVAIPHDCTDGFLGAYWRRPHAYLDPDVRRAISTFSRLSDVEAGLARLRADLKSGCWQERYRELMDLDRVDLGYRLVMTT